MAAGNNQADNDNNANDNAKNNGYCRNGLFAIVHTRKSISHYIMLVVSSKQKTEKNPHISVLYFLFSVFCSLFSVFFISSNFHAAKVQSG